MKRDFFAPASTGPPDMLNSRQRIAAGPVAYAFVSLKQSLECKQKKVQLNFALFHYSNSGSTNRACQNLMS